MATDSCRPAPAGPPAQVPAGSATASPPNVAEVTAHLPTDTRLCNFGNPTPAETERTATFDGDSGNSQIFENLYGLASTADAAAAYAYEIAMRAVRPTARRTRRSP